jgi:hypothetical protein
MAAAPGSGPAGRAAGGPGPGVGRDLVGEYERAFYGSQYASMAPLFVNGQVAVPTGGQDQDEDHGEC